MAIVVRTIGSLASKNATNDIAVGGSGAAVGDVIVLFAAGTQAGAISGHDSAGNTYTTRVGDAVVAAGSIWIMTAPVTNALTAAATVGTTGAAGANATGAVHLTGANLSSISVSTIATGSGTAATHSLTPTVTGVILAGIHNENVLLATYAQPSGWTQSFAGAGSTGGGATANASVYSGYKAATSGSAATYAATVTGGNWSEALIAIAASGGGPTMISGWGWGV